jgi:predicted TPR repeat methyltransferase
MTERRLIDHKAHEFFEHQWQRGDPWSIESSEYERARCAHLLRMLEGRRYARALELGCGAGYFTRLLAGLAEQILALDISPTAITRAQARGADLPMGHRAPEAIQAPDDERISGAQRLQASV